MAILHHLRTRRLLYGALLALVLAALAGGGAPVASQEVAPGESAPEQEAVHAPALAETIEVSDWLVLGPLPGWGRRPYAPSPAFRRYLLETGAPPPEEGDEVDWPGGVKLAWKKLGGGEDGKAGHDALRNGYAYAAVESPGPRRAILEGKGTSLYWVNGDPVAGDVYSSGRLRIPVMLREGTNHIFARPVRGGLQLKLVPPAGLLDFNLRDVTVPHHQPTYTGWLEFGSIPVLNTTDRWIEAPLITTGGDDGHFQRSPGVAVDLAPLGVTEVPFFFHCGGEHPDDEEKSWTLPIQLHWDGGEATTSIQIGLRPEAGTKVETYFSSVDGSVQFYALREPPKTVPGDRYALILSLHGAGVNAPGQANAYTEKDWAYVVAPTNRRPFGFDWEDWGRIDALEVMETVMQRYPIDPDRVFVTGHSMGGHGAWHLGVTDPDLWAGVAPSAGWISFWSYAGGGVRKDADPVERLLWRATSASDTLSLVENLDGIPVFIIHGGNDDNVPPTQARRMVQELEKFHDDFVYREFEGQGHWWGLGTTPYTDCVDLQELWETMQPRRRDRYPLEISFRTMDVGLSHRRGWVEIRSQVRWHERSLIEAKASREERRVEVSTENAAAIALHLGRLLFPGPVTIDIDGQELRWEWEKGGVAALARDDEGNWAPGPRPGGSAGKGPDRCGPFKRVFDNRFLMIVGTGGTPGENEAALRRARLDQQVWWYRANGQAEIIRDTDLDVEADLGRNWIFYGHADMNLALKKLRDRLPVVPGRGGIRVGERKIEGDGLACLAIAPHPESDHTLIGIVGGTDAAGINLSGATRTIASGIGYPDFTVWSVEGLEKGFDGIVAAGFLDAAWKVDPDDTVFRVGEEESDDPGEDGEAEDGESEDDGPESGGD